MPSHCRDAFASGVCCIPCPPIERARGTPGARCTRGLVCNGRKHTRLATESPGSTRRSARSGVNGLCRALPGGRHVFSSPSLPVEGFPRRLPRTRLVLTRGTRTTRLRRPRSAVVCTSFRRSRTLLGVRPEPEFRAERCRVHRIPPREPDDRDAPLSMGRDVMDYNLSRMNVKRVLGKNIADRVRSVPRTRCTAPRLRGVVRRRSGASLLT